eukprot:jgi/Tetstr1/459945/TSEL_005283.t1
MTEEEEKAREEMEDLTTVADLDEVVGRIRRGDGSGRPAPTGQGGAGRALMLFTANRACNGQWKWETDQHTQLAADANLGTKWPMGVYLVASAPYLKNINAVDASTTMTIALRTIYPDQHYPRFHLDTTQGRRVKAHIGVEDNEQADTTAGEVANGTTPPDINAAVGATPETADDVRRMPMPRGTDPNPHPTPHTLKTALRKHSNANVGCDDPDGTLHFHLI